MKFILVGLIFLNFSMLQAQNDEEKAVQKTVEDFFIGFHNQDSIQIKSTVEPNIILQTIGIDSLGNPIVKNQNFNAFLKSIVSIPKTTKFQEIINSFSIQIDGNMANAWTNYEFWMNDSFSHCGVNSFQLIKSGNDWKIIYLIDTRRKTDCKK